MMRSFKICLVAFAVIVSLAGAGRAYGAEMTASSAKEAFSRANDLYRDGDYDSARDLYLSIEDGGYVSSNLYFNIGNAYFKLEEYPKAILYYERAKVLSPSDEDINANLEMAKEFTVDKIEPVPEFIFNTWFRNFNYSLSSDGWAWTGFACFLLTAFFVLAYFFGPGSRFRKLSFFLSIAVFAAGIISVSLAAVQMHDYRDNSSAIVMAPVSPVKSSPDDNGKNLLILHEGAKVYVMEDLVTWKRVELQDGRQGWIKGDNIEVI